MEKISVDFGPWFRDYLTYVEDLESPDIFHLWSGLSVLAAAAQRKVWLDFGGYFWVTPNLYVVLVSEPGRCAKDTSVDAGRELIRDITEIKVMSDSITKERLFVEMQANSQVYTFSPTEIMTHCSLTLYASEMSVLIKKYDKDFVAALCSLFNSKKDMPFKHSTKHSGDSIIINPYLNLMGCTTPQWLGENIQDDVVEGGFSSRTIFAYSDTPKPPVPRPTLTPARKAAKDRCALRVAELVQIGGEVHFGPGVGDFYDKWYLDHKPRRPSNFHMSGYHSRKHVHLMKVAMLRSLSERNDLIITIPDVEFAMGVLQYTEGPMEVALRGVGRNKLNTDCERILLRINNAPGKRVSLKQLMVENRFQLQTRELTEVLMTLCKCGYIKEVQDTSTQEHYVIGLNEN